MRTLTISLSAILTVLICTEVSAWERQPSTKEYTCRIVTGYGTAIGQGHTPLEARENAQLICGSKLIEDYYARRGNIDPDADLELACVNLECQ